MRRTAGVLLVVASLLAGCSDDGGDGGGGGGGGDEVDTAALLAAVADEVIVPAYEDLDAAFDGLTASLDQLCASPDAAALEAARGAWRDVETAWEQTRAGGVGPAMERRLAASVGFVGRAGAVDELLAGEAPVEVEALRDAGAAVKGISALEVALFGEGSDELATAAGGRRCTYLQSVTELGAEAAGEVLSDWQGGYRDDFVEGMDGDPQASLDLLVNELIFRATEVDDQGLRALVEAESADELPASRADGPAAFRLAGLRANLEGIAEALDTEAEGLRLVDLVAARSADTAERLDAATDDAVEAMAPLPDSVTDSFSDPAAVADAHAAVEALKVLLATEVASQLGVTISFSDADGDS